MEERLAGAIAHGMTGPGGRRHFYCTNECNAPEWQNRWHDVRTILGLLREDPAKGQLLLQEVDCFEDSGSDELKQEKLLLNKITRDGGCRVGVLSTDILCALKVQDRHFLVASIFFEHAMEDLLLTSSCLDSSDWPFTVQNILANYHAAQDAWFGIKGPATFTWHFERQRTCALGFPDVHCSGRQHLDEMPMVACLVLSVTSQSAPRDFVRNTYGGECDDLRFYVAHGDERRHEELDVVNLGPIFPKMLLDGSSAPKLVKVSHKRLHALLHAGGTLSTGSSAQWHCILDDDTLFVPQNFRRLVLERGWTPDEPIYAGSRMFWLKHTYGLVFNFGPAVCLSRAALERLVPVLRSASYVPPFMRGEFDATQAKEYAPLKKAWHPQCSLGGAGDWDDVLLAICLRMAGVAAIDTEDTN